MSIEAHNYVIKLKVGNVTAKFVLDRLAERADERFTCFPSIGLLAAELEVSDRTVQRALTFLRNLSLVSDRVNKRPDGSQTTNRYQLHGPWDDYAGTGVPFPEIVTPKQARAEMWAQRPAEGEFREGTAAHVALAQDKASVEEAAKRAAETVARAESAKLSKSARGRKAAAARRRVPEDAGSASGDVPAGAEGVTRMSPPPVTRMSPAPVSPMSPLEPSAPTHSSDDAVSPRSGDVRRTSTSGSRGLGEGGSAASGKSKPSPLTREQRQQVQAVRQLLPGDLNSALPDGTPRNVAEAILDGLAAGQPRERTAEQLVEFRVMRRWDGYWATKFYAGQLGKDPIGPLLAMVKDTAECGSLACEDRFDIFTGEACAFCAMRAVDKRADRKAAREHPPMSEQPATVPKQAVDPMQCCDRCDRGFRSHMPGLCLDCSKTTVNA